MVTNYKPLQLENMQYWNTRNHWRVMMQQMPAHQERWYFNESWETSLCFNVYIVSIAIFTDGLLQWVYNSNGKTSYFVSLFVFIVDSSPSIKGPRINHNIKSLYMKSNQKTSSCIITTGLFSFQYTVILSVIHKLHLFNKK